MEEREIVYGRLKNSVYVCGGDVFLFDFEKREKKKKT